MIMLIMIIIKNYINNDEYDKDKGNKMSDIDKNIFIYNRSNINYPMNDANNNNEENGNYKLLRINLIMISITITTILKK